MREVTLVVVGLLFGALGAADDNVSFSRDVRPILSDNCFKCHGQDDGTRESGLRLDIEESAKKALESGRSAVVSGDPEQSELMRRILSNDPDEMMPPPSTKKSLSAEAKETLRRWIVGGAVYEPHWAFVPPRRADLPFVARRGWIESPIDVFVVGRQESEGLSPSRRADAFTLLRRASLDLVGLPPTPSEWQEFASASQPDRFERAVDRLLASVHYGERWARRWMDLARYADTNGYEKDRVRSIWPYRDWVINAINADMPYDEFTVKQLAGDMLPTASEQDRIATGFHRNTMINEEGGIDPLEFRFYAMVDRVNTTSTIWLGLTMGCSQCHTHKYDPVTQRDYYQLMAYLNNADEPEMPIADAEALAKRRALEDQISALRRNKPSFSFDAATLDWSVGWVSEATSRGGAKISFAQDQAVRFSGPRPEKDLYTLTMTSNESDVVALRVETLADGFDGRRGPGRVDHGNFVLSEIRITAAPVDGSSPPVAVSLAHAEADYAQDGFAPWQSIDGDLQTGWAVGGPDPLANVDHALVVQFEQPVSFAGGTRWTIELDQAFGKNHTIGSVRLGLGRLPADGVPLEFRRREQAERRLRNWIEGASTYATRWTPLVPMEAASNLPFLTIEKDHSVTSSGDQTKSDTYQIRYQTPMKGVTAIRLEALVDDRLPLRGPGRIYYEGPIGDFFLSELSLLADGQPVKLARAITTYANGGNTIDRTLDGNPQTGWSIDGQQGTPQVAIFELDEPIDINDRLDLKMIFERYYSAGMGRFRLSATSDAIADRQTILPASVEDRLATWERGSHAVPSLLSDYFRETAPERSLVRWAEQKLRRQMPSLPTTLVMQERPTGFPRPTHLHPRGEFLQVGEAVSAALPSLFASAEPPVDRLSLARWLSSPENPLTARVTVNRAWAALMGTGLVRTTEDFGYQGESPSHPALLDWLSLEFADRGWSMKELHRLLVTSAAYRQSSDVSPELLERDRGNRLLTRGPRVRLEGEAVRDSLLSVSGLLTAKVGGPSVFPPQPAGVTSEGTYGPLSWTESRGEDRYRRTLYTFAKRTAPYAMLATFDGPSGEACVARREISNTPLQALTMLNDTLTMESARALGRDWVARDGSVEEKVSALVSHCLGRPAEEMERSLMSAYWHRQREKLARGGSNVPAILGEKDAGDADRAAWTLVARAVLNLDEMITKE